MKGKGKAEGESVRAMRKKSREHRKEKRKTIKKGLSPTAHTAQEKVID